ncbi:hypothetical protein ACMFMG_006931 [Clarireedia jacksonii]
MAAGLHINLGPVAEIHAGRWRTSFFVHEELLCRCSPFFMHILERQRPSEETGRPRTISFRGVSPDTIDAFLHFLYIRRPPSVADATALVLQLYYFAEKIGIPSLMHAIMDDIIKFHLQNSITFRLAAMIEICGNTQPGSKLRWYVAAGIAFTMRQMVGNLRWTQAYAKLFDICPELFRDIFVVISYHGLHTWDPQATREEAFRSTFTLCDFHVHGEGEPRCDEVGQEPQGEVEREEPRVKVDVGEGEPQIKVEDSD